MDSKKLMKMLEVFSMLSQMLDFFDSGTKTDEPQNKKPKKKEDMTAEERLAALEKMYEKNEEESELMKRIEALEKKAPKVISDVADPVGIDDIIKGLVPGLLTPDKEDK